MTQLNDGSGMTSEAKLQNEIAGDDTMLHFEMNGDKFHSESFKQGVTFEWVKNKVCEKIEAQYQDTSLYLNGKRIPEPFCLVDMGVQTGATIVVQLVEGALFGEALRQQTLKEIEEEERAREQEEQ